MKIQECVAVGLSLVGISCGVLLAQQAQAQGTHTAAERVVVMRDRGVQKTIITRSRTVRQALQAMAVTIDQRHDKVEPHADSVLRNGTNYITIYRAQPITVIDGERRIQITTAEQSPSRIAQAAGLTLYPEDSIRFTPTKQLLTDGPRLTMVVQRSPQRTITVEEEIDFPRQQQRDSTKPIGWRQVVEEGRKGRRRRVFVVRLQDGAEVARQLISETVLTTATPQKELIGAQPKNPLTKGKGTQTFTDSKGVAHRETYYDLPMNVVARACGGSNYTVRADGAKVDKDGYILVAAHYGNYPRCSVVETSMGPGKVYDTGGFAAKHPHGFDLATDWTNGDGR